MAYTFTEFQQSQESKNPHFLVIGHPISHSLSPVMHQTALDYYGMDARYLALDLEPNEVASFISWCNQEAFCGCNITIPYKEPFMEVVDTVDPFAEQVGVINTILKEEGSLKGFNTDVFGFTEPLKPFLGELESHKAIVFGTGGASKAVKTAFEELGFEEIVFVSRNALGKRIESDSAVIHLADYNQWQGHAADAGILVNSTPLGMYPDIQRTPIDDADAPLLDGKLCYDLVYNPMETAFLKQASLHGGKPINGLNMLIYQGSRAFELWTGKTFPIPLVREKLTQYFSES